MTHDVDDILGILRQGILKLDSSNRVSFVNQNVSLIFGIPEGVIREGMTVDELQAVAGAVLTSPDGPGIWLERLKPGSSNSFQLSLVNGRTVSLTCLPSRVGGWIVICDDISMLVRVEDSLHLQNQRFDAALNNMPHGLCMFDSDTRLILCNASYAKMYTLPEALTQPGTSLGDILSYRREAGNGPANSQTYHNVAVEANAKGLIASQNTVLVDGRIIKITHNPMQNGGYVATHEDVTQTVRLSEEVLQHRDKLEATVQARTAEIERQALELERMLDQERSINELQRQFVAMASHEFRTPLAIIDAAAQRLQRKKGDIAPEFLSEKVDQIRLSVSRIVDLMESILSAGRLDNGKIEISYQRCAVGQLLRTCCERQAMISRSHNFHLDLERLPEYIDADNQTLGQVFTNLLSNAVKYAPGAPDIRIIGWEEAGSVKISISDDGLGIDAEDVPRMFQRYFRARTSTGIAGTGIGLNLVKQIVELHRGSVDLQSIRGCGTTFFVTLPVKAQTQTPSLSQHIDAA